MILGFHAMSGEIQATRFSREAQFSHDASGNVQGNSYSANDTQQLMNQYEALFGPAGRDIKVDSQRNKRHQRWHLPDSIKGYNSFLTDRIDGLITDATSSPFTRNILPYFYLENPDAKIKWNVYSFDEGMASRVPYESAARVLTQTKSSQSGYAIRQGLAIAMEHNFLASEAGRQNFKHQLTQLVGSIQLTNDLDVHIALLQAQSYEKIISEKYYGTERTLQRTGKQYCDMFGIYNKIPNALDLLIEEARTKLKTWGSEPPTFLLCPSNLTLHMTMSPERTNYITNGPDGLKRLAQGPDLPSYRGLNIIHSQKFALEAGREPRNVLRRKVRVAEYYWLPHDDANTGNYSYEFYDQSSDSFRCFTKSELVRKSAVQSWMQGKWRDAQTRLEGVTNHLMIEYDFEKCDVLVLRPNIEHEMLSVIIGRGGTQELGSTFWGQTELACYDDAQHGIWGMSYKYHERAIVTNERNLVRMFDVAFDGYNGGMACDIMQWTDNGIQDFRRDTESVDGPYRGKSMVVLAFPTMRINERYLTVSIRTPVDAEEGEGGARAEEAPQYDLHTVDNLKLDLQRILRKISHSNPFQWNHTERFIETFLMEYQHEFSKLKQFLCSARRAADEPMPSYETCAGYRGGGIFWKRTKDDAAFTQGTFAAYRTDISQQINKLQILGQLDFENMEALYTFCVAKLMVTYALGSGRLPSASDALIAIQEQLRRIELRADQISVNDLEQAIRALRVLTNIDCVVVFKSLFLSGFNGAVEAAGRPSQHWDWLPYFYSQDNAATSNELAEIPNPLILPTMFSPELASAVYVDSESTVPISDFAKYDLSKFLSSNLTKNVWCGDEAHEPYKQYMAELESIFTNQVNISPGEYIRSNSTQIPTLCYHGNMKVRQNSNVVQDIKCTGHMGNSYPGMASIREGRGVQSMTQAAQIMHLQ